MKIVMLALLLIIFTSCTATTYTIQCPNYQLVLWTDENLTQFAEDKGCTILNITTMTKQEAMDYVKQFP